MSSPFRSKIYEVIFLIINMSSNAGLFSGFFTRAFITEANQDKWEEHIIGLGALGANRQVSKEVWSDHVTDTIAASKTSKRFSNKKAGSLIARLFTAMQSY